MSMSEKKTRIPERVQVIIKHLHSIPLYIRILKTINKLRPDARATGVEATIDNYTLSYHSIRDIRGGYRGGEVPEKSLSSGPNLKEQNLLARPPPPPCQYPYIRPCISYHSHLHHAASIPLS